MHSTELREEMLGPHSPASKAKFSSKHLNKLGPSHLKSNWSHRHLISGFPPAAGMCTFDSPRSLEGCKGTAENDHRLHAQWIEHGLCSFVNLKRHCQDLQVKNWTKHASFLSDRGNLIKTLRILRKQLLCFLSNFLCVGLSKLLFCAPQDERPPTEAPVSAHPWKWHCGTLPEVRVWLCFNADSINFKHLCNSKKAEREIKGKSSVCQGEADKFVKGENSLSSLWVGVTNKSESP